MKLKLGVQILKALVEAQSLSANVTAAVLKAAAAAGKFIFRVPVADTISTSESQAFASIKDVQDLIASSELVVDHFTKVRADEIEIVEVVALEAVKAIADAVASSDMLLPFQFIKGLQDIGTTVDGILADFRTVQFDAVVTADAILNEFTKSAVDQTTTSDSNVLAVIKDLRDAVASSDAIISSFSKVLEDSADATDEFNLAAYADDGETMEFIKSLDELIFTSDTFDRVFTAFREFSETVTSSDVIAFGNQKQLSDTSSTSDAYASYMAKPQSDSASASDANIIEVLKALSDTISASEATTLAISLLKNDTASTIDTGSMFYLNYCDPTYFAEQYVGQTTTF